MYVVYAPTVLYYYHNQDAVSQYLADWLEHGERMSAEQEKNPPPGLRRLMQLDTKKILAEARAKYQKDLDE